MKENELMVIDERELLGKEFKIYGTVESPLFLAKDVADWIEHSNPSKMVSSIDEDEKTTLTIGYNGNMTTNQLFLTEDGLYEVLMQSRKPIAKQFKKEVKKILRIIRKTGGYINNSDLMVNTYFKNCDETSKQLVKGLLVNIEEQQKQINHLTNEVMHKENIIVGLVEDISLQEKRQRINQIIRYGANGRYSERWNLLYKEFSAKYHIDLNRRMKSEEVKNMKPKIKSKMDYIDRIMNMTPQLYEICVKVFENDVEKLKEEWESTITREF